MFGIPSVATVMLMFQPKNGRWNAEMPFVPGNVEA
jgi:hypothetical protein